MRYSDWALGRSLSRPSASRLKDTLFVVVGDHGFGAPEQLTEMDLFRFHVPLLLIARASPKSSAAGAKWWVPRSTWCRPSWAASGARCAINAGVATCWHWMNVTRLRHHQPSGSDQTVAMIRGEQILVQPRTSSRACTAIASVPCQRPADRGCRQRGVDAAPAAGYLQVATGSLLANTAGDREREAETGGQKLARAGGRQVVLPAPGARPPREGWLRRGSAASAGVLA